MTGASEWLPALLTFAVAAGFSLLELVASKYPHTFFLVRQSKFLYFYSIIYGSIAFTVFLLLPELSAQVSLTGVAVANPWVRAMAVGLTVKAMLHIRLFEINTGPGRSFPLGVESLVQVFEPWLLRNIDLDHFAASRRYLGARAANHPNIHVVRQKAVEHIPGSFSDADKAAMENDLNKATTIEKVLGVYLAYTGRRTFETLF